MAGVLCLALAACSSGGGGKQAAGGPDTSQAAGPTTSAAVRTTSVGPLVLDESKDYGNRFEDGILPVGDGEFDTDKASIGRIDACAQYASSLSGDAGGAQARGPWFSDDDKTYDLNAKTHVEGNVIWTAEFAMKVDGDTRKITTNDLPTHPTGTFPVAADDPAYEYDRNPNTIKGQTFAYDLAADPTFGSAHCTSGEVGIMLTGVALFNALDAGGRDAGAWEVQDSCQGHPQVTGVYHYHTLSSCVTDIGVDDVIGFALDGFPITGPTVSKGNVLTTRDLDECHGITSTVRMDGADVTTYHYVMTEDFPYSISCFRGAPIDPPGQGGGGPGGPGGGPPA